MSEMTVTLPVDEYNRLVKTAKRSREDVNAYIDRVVDALQVKLNESTANVKYVGPEQLLLLLRGSKEPKVAAEPLAVL